MPTGTRSRTPKNSSASDAIVAFEAASGNVFADSGHPNPDAALAKAELVRQLRTAVAEQKLTRANAGKLLGLEAKALTELLRGRTSAYTIDCLLGYLHLLGRHVQLTFLVTAKSPPTPASR